MHFCNSYTGGTYFDLFSAGLNSAFSLFVYLVKSYRFPKISSGLVDVLIYFGNVDHPCTSPEAFCQVNFAFWQLFDSGRNTYYVGMGWGGDGVGCREANGVCL